LGKGGREDKSRKIDFVIRFFHSPLPPSFPPASPSWKTPPISRARKPARLLLLLLPTTAVPASIPHTNPSLPPFLPSFFSFPFLEDPTDFESKKAGALAAAAPSDYCGSCFEAFTTWGRDGGSPLCCNSCQDILKAYRSQRLSLGKVK